MSSAPPVEPNAPSRSAAQHGVARRSRPAAQRALAVLLACAALLACSGGTGTFTSSKNVPHETSSDDGIDPPGPSSPETHPQTREGTQCLPCTGAYRCVGARDSELQGQNVALAVRGSGCEGSTDVLLFTFACGGTVSIPGRTTLGTWKDVGAGVLSVCFGVVGENECVVCSPTPSTNGNAPSGQGSKTVDAGGRG